MTGAQACRNGSSWQLTFLFACYWLLSLHNLSPFFALPLILAGGLLLLSAIWARSNILDTRPNENFYLLTLSVVLFLIIHLTFTFYHYPGFTFVGRVLLVPFFIIVVSSFGRVALKFRISCISVVLFSVLCSASVMFQHIHGPVDFFADPSLRADFPRYASFAGNLNGFAIGVGFALVSLPYAFRDKRPIGLISFLFLFISFGAVLSLSKIGLLNILISYLFLIKLLGRDFFFRTFFFALTLIAIFYYFDQESLLKLRNFVSVVFLPGYQSDAEFRVDYSSGLDDALFRFSEFPTIDSAYFPKIPFGNGLEVFGSSIGLEGNFFHNDFGNLFSAFGVLGCSLLFFWFSKMFVGDFGRIAVTLLLINLTFASGLLFHFYEGFVLIQLVLHRLAMR